jgi:hypothetical protein
MQTKLTLSLEGSLVEKAKAWAGARGLSLSEAVAELLRQLRDEGEEAELSPWLRGLAGIGAPGEAMQSDDGTEAEYVDYLEAKYQ